RCRLPRRAPACAAFPLFAACPRGVRRRRAERPGPATRSPASWGGVGADAQRQGQHGDQGEQWIRGQHPACMPDIFHQIIEPGPHIVGYLMAYIFYVNLVALTTYPSNALRMCCW